MRNSKGAGDMFSFHLILSLLGIGLASCALRPTTPVLSDVSAPRAPLIADNVRKDILPPGTSYDDVAGVTFDTHNEIWQRATNTLENMYYVTVTPDMSTFELTPRATCLFGYIQLIRCHYSSSAWVIDSVTIRYQDDSRAQGWYNACYGQTMPTPCAFYQQLAYEEGVNALSYAFGNVGVYGVHPYSFQVGYGSPQNSYWFEHTGDCYSITQSSLFAVAKAWCDNWVKPSFDSFAADGYDAGYSRGQTVGQQSGYEEGYQAGNSAGYTRGYNDGEAAQQSQSGTLLLLFGSIADVPIAVLEGLGGLVIWDTPIISIIISLMFVALIVWIIKRFI